MEENRIIETTDLPGDSWQYSLRPHYLREYIGQDKVKDNLEVFIKAAKLRKEALDHVLLYGPPGLGKTTMAGIIANELGVNLRITSGPAIERPGDLAALLTNLQERDLLFIDEIHRLSHSVEEVLYAAMEDYALDIVIGKGPSARSVRIDLPPFTLVGATTQVGRLAPPLRDRFGVICRLEFYKPEDLVLIIKRTADILDMAIDDDGALEIARRSRGTPRIANRLLKRVRDFAQVAEAATITASLANDALNRLEVDSCGLDRTDRRVLQVIIDKFGGGPVGLDTIAAAISESVDAVEDVYEPFLMQQGFLNRTPRRHRRRLPPSGPACAIRRIGGTIIAKLLILTGLFFIVAGLLWMAGDSLGLGNFLGHLPGDISFTKGNTSFHFPIVTCLIISAVLTIVLNLFFRL